MHFPEHRESPHPTSSRPDFLPRLSPRQQGLVPLLIREGARSLVVPLHAFAHPGQLALPSAEGAIGHIFDPCTHIRQKPHSERTEGFRQFPFGNEPEPYEPDHARLSDAELLRLAIEPGDAQRSAGGTLTLSSYHITGGIGSRGREIDLLLAQIAIEHFRRERLAEPHPATSQGIRREIYATIAIPVEKLRTARARNALADAYLALDADGIWVKITGYHERASLDSIRAGSAFLGALRDSGKPLVSCGAGQLHLALLADDISASIGLGDSERFTLPSTWPPPSEDGKPKGRMRMAYHAGVHRSFRVGTGDASRIFAAAECTCGEHEARRPPTGVTVARHAAILRSQQAKEALNGERADRREWLLAAADAASWRAADAEIPGKYTAASTYGAVFDGLDAGREVVLGEQDVL